MGRGTMTTGGKGRTAMDGQSSIGERIRELRMERSPRVTQEQLAELAGLSVDTVAKLEQGVKQSARLGTLRRIADALDVDVSLLLVRQDRVDSEEGGTSVSVGLGDLDEVGRRLQWLAAPNVTDTALEETAAFLADAAEQYEHADAAAVYPVVRGQRQWLDQLLRGHQHPRQRADLFVAAGQLSALLGYLAFDLGNERLALAYCREAVYLGEAVGHHDLLAWVRGTESFIAYYGGRYQNALQLARDGQRYAGDGPESIRLAVNGEARALGKLGDRRGVDEAVDRAMARSTALTSDSVLPPFLSLDAYTPARVNGNAASAYLALDAHHEVEQHAVAAIVPFDRHRALASQALTRVDLAIALLGGPDPQPERAGALTTEALTIGERLCSEVVRRRAGDFVTAAQPWRSIWDIAEAAATWSVAQQCR